METFIDLSDNNNVKNWQQIKDSGIAGVVLKCSEGVTVSDPKYDLRFYWAGNVNLKILAAYHFYHPKDDPQSQFENIEKSIVKNPIKVIAVDLEWCEDKTEWCNTPEQIRYENLKTFISMLVCNGYEVIIYTSHEFIKEYLPKADFLGQHRLWLCAYGTEPGPLPPMWKDWYWWQHTENGIISGVDGEVDVNFINGGSDAK